MLKTIALSILIPIAVSANTLVIDKPGTYEGYGETVEGIRVQSDDVKVLGYTVGSGGIEAKGTTKLWIEDVTVKGAGGEPCKKVRGINLEKVAGALVLNSRVSQSCGANIRVWKSENVVLSGNMVWGSKKRPGFAIRGGKNIRVLGNYAFRNREAGISFKKVNGGVVANNTAKGNGREGDPKRPAPKGSNTDVDMGASEGVTWTNNTCETSNFEGGCR